MSFQVAYENKQPFPQDQPQNPQPTFQNQPIYPPPYTTTGYAPAYNIGAPVDYQNAATVDDHFTISVLNLIFCSWILGIFAVYYASKTREFKAMGNVAMAQSSSKSARLFNIIGCGWGICSTIAVVIFIIVYFSVIVSAYSG